MGRLNMALHSDSHASFEYQNERSHCVVDTELGVHRAYVIACRSPEPPLTLGDQLRIEGRLRGLNVGAPISLINPA